MSQLSDRLGYPLQAIHVPKTVDNDLPITDVCPGFGSVAKYVAVSMREASFDVASMAKTSTKVFVLEVMGRHAGWVALFTAIGAGADYLCLPERKVDVKDMCAKLKTAHAKKKVALVVASEAVLALQSIRSRRIAVAIAAVVIVQALFLAAYSAARQSNIALLFMHALVFIPLLSCTFFLTDFSEKLRYRIYHALHPGIVHNKVPEGAA